MTILGLIKKGANYNWGAGEGWSRVGQVREWRHVVRFDGSYRICALRVCMDYTCTNFHHHFFFLNLLIPFRNGPPNEDFVIYVIIIQQL